MTENSVNIYKTARMAAGITQERSAELIGCSVRTIAAYEQGERIPFDDVVVRMVDIYAAPYLGNQHLRQNSEIARQILPEVVPTNLPQAILHLQKEMNDFLRLRDEMIDITEDGIIDDSERARWEVVQNSLTRVAQAILAIEYTDAEGVTNGKA